MAPSVNQRHCFVGQHHPGNRSEEPASLPVIQEDELQKQSRVGTVGQSPRLVAPRSANHLQQVAAKRPAGRRHPWVVDQEAQSGTLAFLKTSGDF